MGPANLKLNKRKLETLYYLGFLVGALPAAAGL